MALWSRSPRRSVDVRVLWGADLLAAHYLAPGAEVAFSGVHCDVERVVVPPGATGAVQTGHRTEPIEAAGDEPVRIPLAQGMRVRVALPSERRTGPYRSLPDEDVGIAIDIEVGPPQERVPRHLSFGGRRWFLALALVATFIFTGLGCSALLTPPAWPDDPEDGISSDQQYLLQQYLAVAEEKEAEAKGVDVSEVAEPPRRPELVDPYWPPPWRVFPPFANIFDDAETICDLHTRTGWWMLHASQSPLISNDYEVPCHSFAPLPFFDVRGVEVQVPVSLLTWDSRDISFDFFIWVHRRPPSPPWATPSPHPSVTVELGVAPDSAIGKRIGSEVLRAARRARRCAPLVTYEIDHNIGIWIGTDGVARSTTQSRSGALGCVVEALEAIRVPATPRIDAAPIHVRMRTGSPSER
jgi:hypothetical protein